MRRGWKAGLAGLFAAALAGPVLADGQPDTPAQAEPGARTTIQVPVRLSEMRKMKVTPRGAVADEDGVFSPRACNAISSLTDADFSGGSYNAQAGFAQGEMFAATYTVPAAEWPIIHNLTEVIVVTSGATVSTVTQWSLLFFEGEPTNGTLVATYSSDGDVVPHITMPPGTGGVNLQFYIDPGDAEQIVLSDNGSHKFTVAFRIDRHNSPPANPCSQSPSTQRNAFPVTDVSGLAQGSANWLYGLNCGSLGCPTNGGWARFSQLSAGLCRPTGDWVSQTTWSSLNCQPGAGACCLPDGSCQQLTSGDCIGAGGTYQGDGTSCSNITCPAPRGACCFSSGFCISNLTASECAGAGGTYQGNGTACGSGNSCPQGACCLPSGSCVMTTPTDCASQGGTFNGVGSSCANANCPQPTGGCCFSSGFCLTLTQAQCQGAGGSWAGPFTTCNDANGNGRADICEPDCPADFNGDDFVDFFDYDDYVRCFEDSTCPPGRTADFNGDDFVDFFDYDDYVTAFQTGC